MMTSRSEYRLLLRQDNAIFQISEFAYENNLLTDADILIVRKRRDDLDGCVKNNG